MRRILVEKARRRKRLRHGGGRQRLDLDKLDVAAEDSPLDLLALDEALEGLAQDEPAAFELVKLRFFAGLTSEQAAEVLGVSPRTAKRNWAYAKAWLFQRLNDTN